MTAKTTTPERLAELARIAAEPPAGEAAILAEAEELVAEGVLIDRDGDEPEAR